MTAAAYDILGMPHAGGLLIVADHASNRVPADIDLGIAPEMLDLHIAIDIGVAAVAALMVQNGAAAFLANVSRLVCDLNRNEDALGLIPVSSDGYDIPGNALTIAARQARIERFYRPYHAALADLLATHPPALILSLHSFTPGLASNPAEARPWQVGVLYNADDRAARLAIPLLERDGLIVGDQLPYSGKVLNATMNRHAEAFGRPYLGIEVRQDEIATASGQARWAEQLTRVCRSVTHALP